MKKTRILAGLVASSMLLMAGLTGCSSNNNSQKQSNEEKVIKVLAYDSFSLDKKLLKEFEEKTGYKVKIVSSGGGGELVNKLVLTKDTPVADAAIGIDIAFAGRVIKEDVLEKPSVKLPKGAEKYSAKNTPQLIPIDHGQVCLNADKDWFKEKNIAEPKDFADIIKPEYKGLFAGINPTTSSAGLGFFLATVAKYGQEWKKYWTDLKNNEVSVAKDWSTAYNVDFTAGEGKGSKPIVVSYATSPLETLKDDKMQTYTLESTCYDQIEYAGVIKKAKNKKEAEAFIEFMLSKKVQDTLLDSMYVFPVSDEAKISDKVLKFTPPAKNALRIDPKVVDEKREAWLKEWNEILNK
ncbi:thiamine ABC transporter substrate-binding protein [Actinomyces sp. zg-332]|uniref:thiamine ABC transporter substrate-binding protein n=1 Tax=Actinomyces sp. zg-332 TaxID=2708340 RepID=UPI0014211C71|nr:thiamine ABC transporter substrate-binding protein [Actinomyces sp. zg-332]QPK94217.1 thiamine ABC transporter substrate-binding protein [Actinomyces sp. zg-332]